MFSFVLFVVLTSLQQGKCAAIRRWATPSRVIKLVILSLVACATLVGLILLAKYGILQMLMERIRDLGAWYVISLITPYC